MSKQIIKRVSVIVLALLLLNASFVIAQEPELKITRPAGIEKTHNRITQAANLERGAAFRRVGGESVPSGQAKNRDRRDINPQVAQEKVFPPPTALTVQSFGTGGGDINEIEPNHVIAQDVNLPVNVFGRINFNTDIDYFAFQARAGQQIVIEPFATRMNTSDLVADIALFNSAGQQLRRASGNERDDPLITFTPTSNGVFIVGIADVDDVGGLSYNYILNITLGVDVDEREPNDRTAQALPLLPVTVFGDISGSSDVDFYSFVANAGQTLIVDVDAEVFGSRLDPEMNLTDPQTGLELFYNDQFDGDDPRFNIVLPYTGRYIIGVGAFDSNSTGFYRLNASLVSQSGAPIITRVTRLNKKLLEVEGIGFSNGTIVEVNGVVRSTSNFAPGILRAKGKIKAGQIVTVINPPDGRRSNPLLVQ